MNKLVIIIVAIVLLLCCCVVVIGGAILIGGGAFTSLISNVSSAYQENTKLADDFLGDLRDGDYAKAYKLCSPDMQKSLGDSPAGLKDFIDQLGSAPDTWSITGFEMKTDAAVGSYLELTGKVTLKDGTEANLTIQMVKSGSKWEIQYIHIAS